jgi:RNA polymerase sigma factor (sigma-70 family)
MSIPNQEEINNIACEFIRLKNKAQKSKSRRVKQKFEKYKNFAAERLTHLVTIKANRYKKFTNYIDLMQDGFEALMLALRTYDPKKGDFSWWARKYIDTRISRAANAHSTIRFPIKKAKETQPYKTNTIPVIVDMNKNPSESVEKNEISKFVMEAIDKLPEAQKRIILIAYEFDNKISSSMTSISKELEISRPTCIKLLEEAKHNLKTLLSHSMNDRI